MHWVHKLRLRVLALLVAGTLAAIGLASMISVPVWPVLGVAVAAFVLRRRRAVPVAVHHLRAS